MYDVAFSKAVFDTSDDLCSLQMVYRGRRASRRDMGMARAERTMLAYVRGVDIGCPPDRVAVCQSPPVPGAVADQKSIAWVSIV